MAVQADQTERETEFLLGLADEYGFIQGVVGWLDIQSPSLEERLQHFTRFDALKGLRHIVQDEPDDEFLLRPAFLRGIKLLEEYDLCYDILIFPRHLSVALEFISKFPNQKFVLDHIAKPHIKEHKIEDWAEGIRELAKHPQLYCKVSGMVTEADWNHWRAEDFQPCLDVVFEAFGPKRLMFGSDWPVCTLAGNYTEVFKIIINYIDTLSSDDQAMIMGENAERWYGL